MSLLSVEPADGVVREEGEEGGSRAVSREWNAAPKASALQRTQASKKAPRAENMTAQAERCSSGRRCSRSTQQKHGVGDDDADDGLSRLNWTEPETLSPTESGVRRKMGPDLFLTGGPPSLILKSHYHS